MPKFYVETEWIMRETVEIEADSAEAAENKAYEGGIQTDGEYAKGTFSVINIEKDEFESNTFCFFSQRSKTRIEVSGSKHLKMEF